MFDEVPTPSRPVTARVAARARADRLLRRITMGTAMAAVVATGGLSLVAALGYDGHTTQATTATVVTPTTGTSGTSGTRSSTGSTSTPGTTSTSGGSTTTTPTVTTTRGSAHASSGGS